jgi:hypothetical protein
MTNELRFDGDDYQPPRDNPRLTKQYMRVFEYMKDAQWRTLRDIADTTGDPEASVSAQHRHMRKERFGGHRVEKEYSANGLYYYQLIVKQPDEQLSFTLDTSTPSN